MSIFLGYLINSTFGKKMSLYSWASGCWKKGRDEIRKLQMSNMLLGPNLFPYQWPHKHIYLIIKCFLIVKCLVLKANHNFRPFFPNIKSSEWQWSWLWMWQDKKKYSDKKGNKKHYASFTIKNAFPTRNSYCTGLSSASTTIMVLTLAPTIFFF